MEVKAISYSVVSTTIINCPATARAFFWDKCVNNDRQQYHIHEIEIGPQMRRLLTHLIDALLAHDPDDAADMRALSADVKSKTKQLADAAAASTRP